MGLVVKHIHAFVVNGDIKNLPISPKPCYT